MLYPPMHACLKAATVHAGQRTRHLIGEERVMSRRNECFHNAPDIFFGSHPVPVVQTLQVYRHSVTAQSSLAAQVVVELKITQCQFAQSAIDGRPKAQPREV